VQTITCLEIRRLELAANPDFPAHRSCCVQLGDLARLQLVMNSKLVFTHTEYELLSILEELRQREPIFHSPGFGSSLAEYEEGTATDYWEVGASGRRYSREFILQNLSQRPPAFAGSLGWESWDYALRRLAPDTYLLTYVLRQGDRLSRRATIWQSTPTGWRGLYHQGTVVSAEEDDVAPS
jgi:hypothetical protein